MRRKQIEHQLGVERLSIKRRYKRVGTTTCSKIVTTVVVIVTAAVAVAVTAGRTRVQ